MSTAAVVVRPGGTGAGGRRRGVPGPPARPGTRRSGSPRPTGWVRCAGPPGPAGPGAGTALGHPLGPLGDGGVGVGPVDRQAQGAPQVLEDLLVLLGQLMTQGHEVGARDGDGVLGRFGRRGEGRVEGEARVAADPEVVLDPALGGQAVVVPTHGVEDGLPPHPVEAGHGIGVGVREDVPDVERSRHRGGWGVDGVHLGTGSGAVEGVGAGRIPAGRPHRLEALRGPAFRGFRTGRPWGLSHRSRPWS